MTNLLPEKQARAMKAEFRDRFIMAGALMLIATALLAGLMLLPSYLVLSIVQQGDESAIQRARQDQQGMQEISRAQALLKDVGSVLSATSSPSQAITRSVALRPKGIIITHISYAFGSPASMSLTGSGADRDVINAYRDQLLSDTHFRSVSIPVSALVGTGSGDFTANISTTY